MKVFTLLAVTAVVALASLVYINREMSSAEYCGLTPETACQSLEDLSNGSWAVQTASPDYMPVHIRGVLSKEYCMQSCNDVPLQRTQDVSKVQPAGL